MITNSEEQTYQILTIGSEEMGCDRDERGESEGASIGEGGGGIGEQWGMCGRDKGI